MQWPIKKWLTSAVLQTYYLNRSVHSTAPYPSEYRELSVFIPFTRATLRVLHQTPRRPFLFVISCKT